MGVLDQRLNVIISAIDRASGPIRGIGQSVQSLEETAVRAASAIGSAFAAGFGLKSALEASVAFEKGLIGVGKTAGLSGLALAQIGDAITALSLKIPVATDELLAIAEAAGSVGVTGQQNILKFTETIAKLGRASDLAGGEAATTLARLLNVTNESAGTVDKLAAVIVALGNAFPAAEKEIAHMAGEVARSAAIFGVSSAQAAALGTAMASIGVQAELGGSAVGKTMREIDSAIRTGGKAFSDLQLLTSMTGEQLKKTFKEDAVGVFAAFLAGLDKVRVSGGSAAQELEKFDLKGEEILKVLPSLAANSTMLGEALQTAAAESANATALNDEFSSSAKSLDSELKLLSSTFDVVNRRVGDQFAPAVRQLSETLREVGEHGSSLNSLLAVFSALASATISVAGFVAKWGGEIATVVTIVAGAKILGWARAIASVGAESTLAAIAAGRLGDAFRAFGAGLLVPFANLPNLLRTFAVAMGELATTAFVAALNFGLISTAVAGIGIYKLVEFLGLMWEAAKVTDEVEARAKDADDAYKALAAKTQELAKAMEEAFGGDIAKQMSFISGLSEKQLGQTKELIRAKLTQIQTERARLELEQKQKGHLVDNSRLISELTEKEKVYMKNFATTTGEITKRQAAQKSAGDAAKSQVEAETANQEALKAGLVLRQQEEEAAFQRNTIRAKNETDRRIQSVNIAVAAEVIKEREGVQQRVSIALQGQVQLLALASERVVQAARLRDEMKALGVKETDDYKNAVKEQAKINQELQRAKLEAAKELTQHLKSQLDAGLKKEQEIARQIIEIRKAMVDARAKTEDALLAVKRRGLSEEQLQASLELEFTNKMVQAKAALAAGDAKRAADLAANAQQIAGSLKSEEEALKGIAAAGTLQQEALAKQEIAAQRAAKAQAEQNAQLRNNLQSITVTIEKLVTRLAQGFKIDVDTKNADNALQTLKSTAEKTNLMVKAQVDSREAENTLLELALPAEKPLVVLPDLSLYDWAMAIIEQDTWSQHTIYVSYVYGYHSGGLVAPSGFRNGGSIARFAEGGAPTSSPFVPRSGQIPGWDPARVDKVPALLTLGEFVMNALSVRILNQVFPGLMNMLNSIRTLGQAREMLSGLRGFRAGGMVTSLARSVVQGYSAGGLVRAGTALAGAGAGSQTFQFAPVFNIQGGSAPDMERVFRESIIPSLKEALRDNASGITTALRRELGRG